MGLEQQLTAQISRALDELVQAGELKAEHLRPFNVEPPRKGGSGHVATNVALALAKGAGKKPRDLALALAEKLRAEATVAEVEVAGPGFINVTCAPAAFHAILQQALDAGAGYGHAPSATQARVNVEFVSANPTGPLLISHGRGAVVGDAVARLFEASGHRVTREYYLNDFGNQVRKLGASVLAASRGEEPPEGGYGGYYVKDMADWLREHRSELLEGEPKPELVRECISLMVEGIPGGNNLGIRDTLANLGIEFDVWTSEEALHRSGKVGRTLDRLARDGRLEEREGALFFVTGDDDDKDRVVKKSDGLYTYFASDIAYHDDKLGRGFELLIDVWGADHHGYIPRMKASLAALGHPPDQFQVLLFQLVKLLRDGKPVKMGKRLGNLITIQEVVEEIDEAVGNAHAGRDALRYFYLSRKTDTPISLDVELAKKQSSDNPVFYIQYGHARLCSILAKAEDDFEKSVPRYSPALAARLTDPRELELIAMLGRYPDILRSAAQGRDPQQVILYLEKIARAFQSYYTQTYTEGDTVLPQKSHMAEADWQQRWDWEKTAARLLWVDAIRQVYRSGLELLGITAPERMRARDAEDGEAEGES